jgi:hypothetical protein
MGFSAAGLVVDSLADLDLVDATVRGATSHPVASRVTLPNDGGNRGHTERSAGSD